MAEGRRCWNGYHRCDIKKSHFMSQCNENGSGRISRTCDLGTTACDIQIKHGKEQCNRNNVPIHHLARVPLRRVPAGTHDCKRRWSRCNSHSEHWRSTCSVKDCPYQPTCNTCRSSPPCGPLSPCRLASTPSAKGEMHYHQRSAIDGCPMEPPPCYNCEPPRCKVYVIQRSLRQGIFQAIANTVAIFVGGSVTHWAVLVIRKHGFRPTDIQFELVKSSSSESAIGRVIGRVNGWLRKNIPNRVNMMSAQISPEDLESKVPGSFTAMENMGGVTYMTDEEIEDIAKAIISVSPYYRLRTASCQTFAVDLALRIVETPTSALLDMKTEQTRLRMKKGDWDEDLLNRSVQHDGRVGDRIRKKDSRAQFKGHERSRAESEAKRLAYVPNDLDQLLGIESYRIKR